MGMQITAQGQFRALEALSSASSDADWALIEDAARSMAREKGCDYDKLMVYLRRLSGHLQGVYVAATAEADEAELLHYMRRELPQMPMAARDAARLDGHRALAAVIRSLEEEPYAETYWERARKALAPVVARSGCDQDAILEFLKLLIGRERLSGAAPDPKSKAVADDYLARHIPTLTVANIVECQREMQAAMKEYEAGKPDLLRLRIAEAARCADHLDGDKFDEYLRDVEEFTALARRHGYTKAQLQETMAHMAAVTSSREDRVAAINSEIRALKAVLASYDEGPVQLVALEKQWLCYRALSPLLGTTRGSMRMAVDPLVPTDSGAFMPATLAAVREADPYCWSPMCVEAVASAAASLPVDAALDVAALSSLGQAGWWWFDTPIPVQTLETPAAKAPVCALVWRIERRTVDKVPRVWFSTFVADRLPVRGREQDVPVPSTAFIWPHGTSLATLSEALRVEYARIPKGDQAAGIDVTCDASMWFARFTLAAATWLQQRIIGLDRGQGTRQVARQLEREHKLPATPSVRVVHLRRRETVHRAPVEGAVATTREYSVRWVVKGHFRNVWYPSRGEHKIKWIDSFIAGPDDKPLKQSSKVYAVER